MEKKEEIISNKIKCKKCGDVIESKSTNDLKRCSCGAVAVDGGKAYLKRIGNDEEYEELSIMTEQVKQMLTFSTFENIIIMDLNVWGEEYERSKL